MKESPPKPSTRNTITALLAERALRAGVINYVNGRRVTCMADVEAIREGRFK